MEHDQSGSTSRHLRSSSQQPVAGPSRSRDVTIDAITGTTIEQQLPQINKLVAQISSRLLTVKDEAEALSVWLLGLDEVVSAALEGEALAEWTARLSRAGGDVDDEDKDEDEMDDAAGAASTSAKGKGKAGEVGEGWRYKARDAVQRIEKSAGQAHALIKAGTPYGSIDLFPWRNAEPVRSTNSQLIRTTTIRFITHANTRNRQIAPIPPHHKVEEILDKILTRVETEQIRTGKQGKYGSYQLDMAVKWARKAWPDPEILYGPDPLPPPAVPHLPLAAAAPAAANAADSNTAASASQPQPGPAPPAAKAASAPRSSPEPEHEHEHEHEPGRAPARRARGNARYADDDSPVKAKGKKRKRRILMPLAGDNDSHEGTVDVGDESAAESGAAVEGAEGGGEAEVEIDPVGKGAVHLDGKVELVDEHGTPGGSRTSEQGGDESDGRDDLASLDLGGQERDDDDVAPAQGASGSIGRRRGAHEAGETGIGGAKAAPQARESGAQAAVGDDEHGAGEDERRADTPINDDDELYALDPPPLAPPEPAPSLVDPWL
ncbi:hypothetical protein JCM8208_003907, partial [Rhodotorula glutinis]